MLRRLIFVVTPFLLLTGCAPAARDDAATGKPPTAAAPTAPPDNYQGRWWSWAASEPEKSNPVVDRVGKYCGRNQPSDLWFLAGTFGGHLKRRCTVPAGRPIVAPLVNLWSGKTADCREFMAPAKGSAILDGVKVPVIKVAAEEITITAVAGNAVGIDAGRWSAIGCGLWIYIRHLPAGTHQLKIRGESGDFNVGVDYTLVVSGQPAA